MATTPMKDCKSSNDRVTFSSATNGPRPLMVASRAIVQMISVAVTEPCCSYRSAAQITTGIQKMETDELPRPPKRGTCQTKMNSETATSNMTSTATSTIRRGGHGPFRG